MTRFALIGAAGFVAPRHLQAIKDVGGKLVAALDPHDSVGILDKFDRKTEFFTEPERFERHLEKLRREGNPIDWLVVCSPNYLHDTHIRLGLRAGAKVLCEKPLVLDPKNLDALRSIEEEYQEHVNERRVFTVLQLRHVLKLIELHGRMRDHWMQSPRRHRVHVEYATPRGAWYHQSWKGDANKSGGLVTNIGIHLLDLLVWVFGEPLQSADVVPPRQAHRPGVVKGSFPLLRADVSFTLSIAGSLPRRTLLIDDEQIDFTDGFEKLHTTVYQETLAGRGHGIEDARPAIELAWKLRHLQADGG